MVADNGDLIADAMRVFADRRNYPIVFGCMTGKDRTGLIAALFLSVLGASSDDIMDDYLASRTAVAHNADCMRAYCALMEDGSTFGGAAEDEDDTAQRLIMCDVHARIMRVTLAWFKAEHGGPVEYLRALGLTEAELQAMRDINGCAPAAGGSRL
jgi:hypothetical protein